MLDFYVLGKTSSRKAVIAQITREVYVVERLKAKVLIGMDIIGLERMSVNVDTKLLTIGSCAGIIVPVSVTPKPNSKVRRSIRSRGKIIIQLYALIQVPIKMAGVLLIGRDFSF